MLFSESILEETKMYKMTFLIHVSTLINGHEYLSRQGMVSVPKKMVLALGGWLRREVNYPMALSVGRRQGLILAWPDSGVNETLFQ